MARSCVRPVPEELEARPVILYGIQGHLSRFNDAVFQPALPRSRDLANQRTLVFFGGDLQNFSYLMDQSKDSVIDHQVWCLEQTALRLGHEFPSCNVVVIKPSRVAFDDVSCFDNFVENNVIGIPKHYYHYMALMHLEKLLETISIKLQRMDPDVLFNMLLRTLKEERLQEKHKLEVCRSWQYDNITADRKRVLINWQKKISLHKYPVTLVAFSKGCVVLNQILYEFHYARSLEPNHVDSRFIELIREMYWLDSGHCGRHTVYPTSMGLLRTLSNLGIIVHVHVSLYMSEDEKRPWIQKQVIEFVKGLTVLKADVNYFYHISTTEDLASHFSVLMRFKTVEKKHLHTTESPMVQRRTLPPDQKEAASIRARRLRLSGDTIGFCLINPHDTPYLGLQIAIQKTGFTCKATHMRLSCPQDRNFDQILPVRLRNSSTQSPSQMRTNSAETPISDQTQSTPVQATTATAIPSPSKEVWPDLLPQNENQPTLLMNELIYPISEEEAQSCRSTAYCDTEIPVIAIPNSRNPLSIHVFMPVKETYVPEVSYNPFVENEKDGEGGEGLPPNINDDNLERATSSPDSMASDSERDSTGPESVSGSRANVSSPDPSDSDSDALASDSEDLSDGDVTNPDSDGDVTNPDSDGNVSNPDSDSSSSSGTSSPINSRIDSRSGHGHTLSGSTLMDALSRVASAISIDSQSTVTQLEPSQRATPRRARIAQPNVSQNRVDTPRETINSYSTTPGSEVVSSSRDSVAPRAGTSRARVRAREVHDEPQSRYNLRKRLKRCYDENILHIHYQ